MKKGVFIYGRELLSKIERLNGIDRKVNSQIKSLNTENIECKQICYPFEKRNWWYSLKVRLPFFNACPLWIYHSEYENIDFIYFRRHAAITMYMLKVLKKIKERNPTVKILLEIPTFPYDKELSWKWKNVPTLWKDQYNRKKIYKYIDRIVTVDDSDEIFGTPTIKMVNGIDVNNIAPISPLERKWDDTIHVIAVAMLTIWHGYDRFLEGLGLYYKNGGERNIVFHIVGEGESKIQAQYENIIHKYQLDEHVVMHGYKTGKELDEIYNQSQIGIISLATHRKNVYKLSTLKSREYLAKGLPVISSGITDVFESNNFAYNLVISSDETPINIEEFIIYYDSIYKDVAPMDIITEIRKFALQTVDVHVTMKPVVDYLGS